MSQPFKRKVRFPILIQIGLIILLCAGKVNAGDKPKKYKHLFTEISPASELVQGKLEKPKKTKKPKISFYDNAIIRSRKTGIDLGLLKDQGIWLSSESGSQTRLVLELFDDVTVIAVMDKVDIGSNKLEWVGHVEGDPDSLVIFVQRGKALAGEITYAGHVYEIKYAGNRTHVIREVDESSLSGEHQAEEVKSEKKFRDFGPEAGPSSIKKKVIRSRKKSIDFNVLNEQEMWLSPDLASQTRLDLQLFDDVILTAVRDKVNTSPHGVEWIGHIEDSEGSLVLLVRRGKSLAGKITHEGRNYRVRCSKRGAVFIREIDASAHPIDEPPVKVLRALKALKLGGGEK